MCFYLHCNIFLLILFLIESADSKTIEGRNLLPGFSNKYLIISSVKLISLETWFFNSCSTETRYFFIGDKMKDSMTPNFSGKGKINIYSNCKKDVEYMIT